MTEERLPGVQGSATVVATLVCVRATSPRDPCVVLTKALAHVLRSWVARWNEEHPDLAPNGAPPKRTANGHFAGNTVVGGLTVLRERAEQVGPPVPRHVLGAIIYAKTRYTELRTADQLVTAIEGTLRFYDGSLLVFPNPQVPDSHRRCCGGVSTGVQFLEAA